MPIIASGGNATIAVLQNQILTVQCQNGAEFTFENPVGTKLLDSGSNNVFGPFTASGNVKVNSIQGAIFYEVAGGTVVRNARVSTSGGVSTIIDDAGNVVSSGGTTAVATATAIPFTSGGSSFMVQQTVSSVLAFTPVTAGAVQNASVYTRLIADGVNVPTFTGFKEWGGSLGYDNRSGIANQIQFFYDGYDYFYLISQSVGAVPSASGVSLTGPSAGFATTASSAFTVSITPSGALPSGTVIVTPNDGAAGGAFMPTSLTFTGATNTGTFTYTPSATGGVRSISITNNSGLSNPAAVSYTVFAVSNLRFGTLTRITESGTNPYSYTGTGGNFGTSDGDSVASVAFQSGIDGSLVIRPLVTPSNNGPEILLAVDPSNAGGKAYNTVQYSVVNHAAGYQPFTSGSLGTASGVLGAANDLFKVARVGTTLTFSVSKDSGATYTTVATWTGVSTGVLYVHSLTGNAGVFQPISYSGLA